MDLPVFLDTLASSNVERFHAEAAQQHLVNAALGPRPLRVLSLGRRLWAMAAGSVGAGWEPVPLTPRLVREERRSPHRALPQGGVNPS
jgi:hypothetical protein